MCGGSGLSAIGLLGGNLPRPGGLRRCRKVVSSLVEDFVQSCALAAAPLELNGASVITLLVDADLQCAKAGITINLRLDCKLFATNLCDQCSGCHSQEVEEVITKFCGLFV